MIFQPALAHAVATARKTTHRVPAGSTWRLRQRVTIHEDTTNPDTGEKNVAAHVEIIELRTEQLRDLTRPEAEAEGYGGLRGAQNFKRAWLARSDAAWVAEQKASAEGLTDDAVSDRFKLHHGRSVDVLSWHLVEAPARFLAPGGGTTTVRHRAVDDLEIVDEVTQKRYAERASKEGEKQRASFRRDLEAERARRKAERGRSMRLAPHERRAA